MLCMCIHIYTHIYIYTYIYMLEAVTERLLPGYFSANLTGFQVYIYVTEPPPGIYAAPLRYLP